MLKRGKLLALSGLKAFGMFARAFNSGWRGDRLLILGYHGISQDDEHLWNPRLYMSPVQFRDRMRLLVESGCAVLPLGEAVTRLFANELPPRSVAITFDDGTYDFLTQAWPISREFGFPVTLYLTSYYSYFNRPVFDVICSYILWKGRDRVVDGADFTERRADLDLRTEASRMSVAADIRAFVQREGLSALEKDTLAAELARRIGVDYERILSRRILHLLKPDEVSHLATEGADIQLHTHRHRVPINRGLFLREIEENRRSIEPLTHARTEHFCYPSGIHNMQFLPWLDEAGMLSATTCEPGLATRDTHRFLLPRLVDTSSASSIEFEGWLVGISAFLPRRRTPTLRSPVLTR